MWTGQKGRVRPLPFDCVGCAFGELPLYDRAQEHDTTDVFVIAVHPQLIGAAKTLRDSGTCPKNTDDPKLGRKHMVSFPLEAGAELRAETAPRRNPDNRLLVAEQVQSILD